MINNLIHNLFYIMPLFFIWSEFYHLKNKNRLYVKFNQRYINGSSTTDYIYYITKLIYLLWIIIGLFSHLSHLFMIILLISSIKFLVMLLKSKKFNDIYDVISSIICISTLIYIFIKALILR